MSTGAADAQTPPTSAGKPDQRALRRAAIGFVVAIGIGSMLADTVYEGARSIIGPYLVTLGASAAVVGLFSGIGEFVGYGLRVGAGYLADRTRQYWALTIGGYALNVFAVPLLGLAAGVEVAMALIIAERLGKALRVPARDTLISYASTPIGRGFAFGLHEALDQVGAVVGPLILALFLALRPGDYRTAFLILTVPAVLTVVALFRARSQMQDPEGLRAAQEAGSDDEGAAAGARSVAPDTRFWRYSLFTVLTLLGFAPFPLAALHLTTQGVLLDYHIPLLFAFAMAVDAGIAVLTGWIYDRRGLVVLAAVPLTTMASLALFSTSVPVVWIAAGIWGSVIGIQESTLRAAVADLVPIARRATGYGLFNASYGIALLIGGTVLGLLYERSVFAVGIFVIAAELAALAALVPLLRRRREAGAS